VIRDERSVEVFRDEAAVAELGTHLHGEYAEPGAFDPEVTSAFQRDYPPEVERAKLAWLTAEFQRAFGRAPRSFRAGRFGVGPESLGILESLGYVADSSVTPLMSWHDAGGGPCFLEAPTQPYHPARRSPGVRGQPGECAILEVPVTIRRHPWARVPLLGRAFAPRWLRPSRLAASELVDLARKEISDRATPHGDPIGSTAESVPVLPARGPIVLNVMFHNVEVIGGASPYARSERQARTILDRVRALLAFAARESIPIVGLSDVAEVFA
jgi:hypothetical protein